MNFQKRIFQQLIINAIDELIFTNPRISVSNIDDIIMTPTPSKSHTQYQVYVMFIMDKVNTWSFVNIAQSDLGALSKRSSWEKHF